MGIFASFISCKFVFIQKAVTSFQSDEPLIRGLFTIGSAGRNFATCPNEWILIFFSLRLPGETRIFNLHSVCRLVVLNSLKSGRKVSMMTDAAKHGPWNVVGRCPWSMFAGKHLPCTMICAVSFSSWHPFLSWYFLYLSRRRVWSTVWLSRLQNWLLITVAFDSSVLEP